MAGLRVGSYPWANHRGPPGVTWPTYGQGAGVCARRKERKGAEQRGANNGAPGPELLQPWQRPRTWVHTGSFAVVWWL